MADTKQIKLFTGDKKLVREATIGCPGDYPELVCWDDSPDGERTFIHDGAGVYYEQPTYLLSLGEERGPQTIIVNGREMKVSPRALTYEDVVELAGKKGQPTITWRVKNASGGLSDGTMSRGSFSIVPSNGMVFNVVHTDNA